MPGELEVSRVCVAGGGPAGLMTGLLLARAGIESLVLEKSADFERGFRGDTVHASTLDLLAELGWLEDLLRLPHERASRLEVLFGDVPVGVDFSRLPGRSRHLVFMPQKDFLAFLARQGARFPAFRLRMGAEITDFLEDDGRVLGVRARTDRGPLEVRADLVVAAGGRESGLRELARLPVEELGSPVDVLWFLLPRRLTDPALPFARFLPGGAFVMFNEGALWRCGYVIRKDSYAEVTARGLPAFRRSVALLAPLLADRVAELRTWDQVQLLEVRVDRLRQWCRDGLLCLGDAAHGMSPVGGVGINLAIQDAVAAANLLAGPLRAGRPTVAQLRRVEARRRWPTRATQRLQLVLQRRLALGALRARGRFSPPLVLRLVSRLPLVRRLPGRFIGRGLRPERLRAAAR